MTQNTIKQRNQSNKCTKCKKSSKNLSKTVANFNLISKRLKTVQQLILKKYAIRQGIKNRMNSIRKFRSKTALTILSKE